MPVPGGHDAPDPGQVTGDLVRLSVPAPFLTLATLSAFRILSGLRGLWKPEAARAVLTDHSIDPLSANLAVVGRSVLDVALGFAVLVRSRLVRLPGRDRPGAVALGQRALLVAVLRAASLESVAEVLPATILDLVAAALLDGQ